MNHNDYTLNMINGYPQIKCAHCGQNFGSVGVKDRDEARERMETWEHICPGVDLIETLRSIEHKLEMFAGLITGDNALINYIDERVREKIMAQAQENKTTEISGNLYPIPPPIPSVPPPMPRPMTDAELARRGL